MPRLKPAFLERFELFGDRVLDVAEAARRARCPHFVRDQMSRAGTSVAANMYEAAYALSRADFAHSVGVVAKELGESLYWLRMVGRRQWVKPQRFTSLMVEADELCRIISTMGVRTREG